MESSSAQAREDLEMEMREASKNEDKLGKVEESETASSCRVMVWVGGVVRACIESAQGAAITMPRVSGCVNLKRRGAGQKTQMSATPEAV